MKQTILNQQHRDCGAKMVPFGGWDMPIHYGSQLKEHNAVREDAGMFDVSHMTVVDVTGHAAKAFLQFLFANDVAKLTVPGKALYSCMLNESGGVIDDLIVYFLAEQHYRVVVNAATRDKDLAWLEKQAAAYEVSIKERDDVAMIAVQGPQAIEKTQSVLNEAQRTAVASLSPFQGVIHQDWLFARTGYTGEDGYEIMLPAQVAADFWQALLQAGVAPCGLGARDTLRLEAGLNLYGSDMDETTSPLESNLAWTIAWDQVGEEPREFMGKQALLDQKQAGVGKKLVGLVLTDRGMLRDQLPVFYEQQQIGTITSGSFSPTIGKAIGLARIANQAIDECQVQVRGKYLAAKVVKPCFVRKGKVLC